MCGVSAGVDVFRDGRCWRWLINIRCLTTEFVFSFRAYSFSAKTNSDDELPASLVRRSTQSMWNAVSGAAVISMILSGWIMLVVYNITADNPSWKETARRLSGKEENKLKWHFSTSKQCTDVDFTRRKILRCRYAGTSISLPQKTHRSDQLVITINHSWLIVYK